MTAGTAVEESDQRRRRTRRLQIGARSALALGIGASLAANVLAADPSLIGRVIAAWPPVALLVTVELWDRVPTSSGARSRLRIAAAAAIAGIAAWVSYWHMVEVALSYGEATIAAHLVPFSVDGLVVVASVALVELNTSLTAQGPRTVRSTNRKSIVVGSAPGRARPSTNGSRPKVTTSGDGSLSATADRANGSTNGQPASAGRTRDQVAALARSEPGLTQVEIAQRLGITERTVRRHQKAINDTAPTAPVPAAVGPREETT